jgi:hypothetical protein
MAIDFFPLLDLPPELRTKILLFATLSPYPSHLIRLTPPPEGLENYECNPPQYFHPPPLSLLLTSVQIYNEVHPLYYTSHTFLLPITRDPSSLDFLLAPSFSHNLLTIRSLFIWVHRWGYKNFFASVLIPKFESCILKGNLRRLEVVVKERDARGWIKEAETGRETMENSVWSSLKRLCQDVDLEAVKLWSVKLVDSCSHLSLETGELKDVTWLCLGSNKR